MYLRKQAIVATGLWVVFGLCMQCNAQEVWKEDFSQGKPVFLAEFAKIVEEKGASGGRVVEFKYPGKNIRGPVLSKQHLKLANHVTITFYVKGKGLGDLLKTIRFWVTVGNEKKHAVYRDACSFYRGSVNDKEFLPVSIEIRLPAKPSQYSVSIDASWVKQENGKNPLLWLDKIVLTDRNTGSPYIGSAATDRVCYEPGSKAVANVYLVNPGNKAFDGTIILTDYFGLHNSKLGKKINVSLGPNKSKTVKVDFNVGNAEVGHQIEVKLQTSQGKTLSEYSDLFCVGKDPRFFQTMNMYDAEMGNTSEHGVFYVSPASREQIANSVAFMIRRKMSRHELFSWSWCELAGFIPPEGEDPYIGNEGRWWMSMKKYPQIINGFHDKGVKVISYVGGPLWGDAAYRLFQQHPSWFLYGRDGDLGGNLYDMKNRANYQKRNDFDFVLHKTPYFYALLNPTLPECRRWIADQFIDIAKRLKFDGARWDVWNMEIKPDYYDMLGNKIAANWKVADKMTVESLQALKKLVAKESPNFTWGYNYGAPEENENTPGVIKEKCRNGGWILDEVAAFYHSKTSPFHVWDKYRDRLIGWGDFIRKSGGIYNPFKLRRHGGKNEIDRLYVSIFQVIASGRHKEHYSNNYTQMGRLGEVAFRFSNIYLGKNLRLLPASQKIAFVKENKKNPLWWKTMVHENISSAGRKQIIVHLVNPPVFEDLESNPEELMRPPVKNTTVTCAALDGKLPNKAYLLMAESVTTGKHPKTQVVQLKMKSAGAVAQVTVPEVLAWKTVVFEY